MRQFTPDYPLVDENTKVGSKLGTVNGFDGDYSSTLSFLLDDDSNGTFSLQTSARCRNVSFPQNVKISCTASLVLAKDVNFEVKHQHEIVVRVTDQAGLHRIQRFTVTIIDMNDQSSDILLNGKHTVTLNEGKYKSQRIGQLTTLDEDRLQPFTYQIVDSEMMKYFEIRNNRLLIKDDVVFDYENKNTYNMSVRSTDKSVNPLSITRVFNIRIEDVNERPSSISLDNLSFKENCNQGTVVANITVTDPDNSPQQRQNHTCTISRSSLAALEIVGNDQLVVSVGTIDYEQVCETLVIFESWTSMDFKKYSLN